MSVSGIYALTSELTDSTLLTTGNVNIELQNYKLDENNSEVKFEESTTRVMPGDEISLIPKIWNLAQECYVRYKVFYINDSTDFTNYVSGLSTDFTKIDDYYYSVNTLLPGESVKIFDKIKIPLDIINNGEIKLEITVEAVQSKNFEPDYTLSDPWKNIVVQKSERSSYNILPDTGNNNIFVIYNNNTEGDVTLEGDLWDKISTALPGDTLLGKIRLLNKNKPNAKYYLNINYNSNNQEELDLLNNIDLEVKNKKGEAIYKGKMLLNGKMLLGNYNVGDSDDLQFTVHIPEELGNEYTLINLETGLEFSCEYEDAKDNPKTGDSINWVITIFFISSFGLVITMYLAYKERKEE